VDSGSQAGEARVPRRVGRAPVARPRRTGGAQVPTLHPSSDGPGMRPPPCRARTCGAPASYGRGTGPRPTRALVLPARHRSPPYTRSRPIGRGAGPRPTPHALLSAGHRSPPYTHRPMGRARVPRRVGSGPVACPRRTGGAQVPALHPSSDGRGTRPPPYNWSMLPAYGHSSGVEHRPALTGLKAT